MPSQELALDHISQHEMCVLLKYSSHTLLYGSNIHMQSRWISIVFFSILTPLNLISNGVTSLTVMGDLKYCIPL
jgi:hypothetical protein